jgi:hypothetical protein
MEGTYASNMTVHSVLNVYCLLFIQAIHKCYSYMLVTMHT